MGKKSKPEQMREAVLAPPPRASIDSVLDHFFAEAGGPEKVARMLYDEFQHAQSGSMIRSKILELVLRRLERAEMKGRPTDNLDDLSDEDIERQLRLRESALLAQTVPPTA